MLIAEVLIVYTKKPSTSVYAKCPWLEKREEITVNPNTNNAKHIRSSFQIIEKTK